MTGQTISHYRILDKLGEGGMGVVYKAEDTKLRRTVALKFLPPHATENRERFLREAQAAAALNHPNICTVHEIDEEHGFLAMELIEGQSVRDKIAERPLPLEEALDIVMQACAGLQAAHEKGIVHRDIKPANLMLTAQGQVKILDFGLAQVGDRTRITKTGSSLGTPASMSPEQVKGEAVDRRTDIWSLGVVLYEMVSGRVPFRGESEPGVTYAITHTEPEPLSAVRSGVPLELDRITGKALAKDPAHRYQHVEDLLVDLRRLPAAKTVLRQTGKWRGYLPWAIAAAAILVAVVVSLRRPTTVSGPGTTAVSMVIPIPPDQELVPRGAHPFDVSPDGSKLVYAATEGGRTKLFLRPIDAFDAKLLPGTEDALSPFFSPDGRWIGFSVKNNLFKVASSGGSPILIAPTEAPVRFASWGPDDQIVYSSRAGLQRIGSSGGRPAALTVLKQGDRPHSHPRHLAGNAGVLFTIMEGGERGSVALVSLHGGAPTVLFPGRSPHHVNSGHIVYAVNDVLRSVPFDATSLKVTGSHTAVLEDVYTSTLGGNPYFRVSGNGTLFYVAGRNEHSLVRVDRAGHTTPLTSRRAGYRLPRISRDGKFVAVTIDPPDETDSHVWTLDLQRGTFSKLTHEGHNLASVLTPDGARVAWMGYQTGQGNADVYWQATDGSGKAVPLQATADSESPSDFTSDGKTLIYHRNRGSQPRMIWVAPVDGSGPPSPLLQSAFSGENPRLSPDGRWLAYSSNETGRDEICVRRFPQSERKWTVTSDGGRLPVWSRDGKEIFYLEGKRMMAIPVQTGADFSAGRPVFLFDRHDLTGGDVAFDVIGDGFLLMVQRDPLGMLTEFRVIQNWPSQWKH